MLVAYLNDEGTQALSGIEYKNPCLSSLSIGNRCEVKAVIPVVDGSKKNSVLLIHEGGLYSFSEEYLTVVHDIPVGWIYE